MLTHDYWNCAGSKKDFEDPFYIDKLEPYLSKSSKILDYGCGYGRLMALLKAKGYENIVGFDSSQAMVERGKKSYPEFDINLALDRAIPCQEESFDAVILSTVLCCIVEKDEQRDLIKELFRVLKRGAVFYLTDFLLCEEAKAAEKYARGYSHFGEWGVYETNERLKVRHHTDKWIFDLLTDFEIHWFEQFSFKTMNHNPAKTFHCIARKPITPKDGYR